MGGDKLELRDVALQALIAVAAGIGTLGFVTLVGGFVLYERFDGVGLPGDHAIAVTPRSDLLVIGASVLLPILTICLLVTAVMWRGIERVERQYHLAQYAANLFTAERQSERESGPGQPALNVVETQEKMFQRLGEMMLMIASVGAVAAGYIAVTSDHWPSFWNLAAYAGILIIAVASAMLTATLLSVSAWKRIVQAAVFSAFMVLLVGLTASAIGWIQSREEPRVKPAVVILNNYQSVSGIFVAETANKIYLGQVTPKPKDQYRGYPSTGRIIAFERSQVLRFGIGRNELLPELAASQREIHAALLDSLRAAPSASQS